MTFTPVDLPTYPPDIQQQVIADYQARKPDWVPSDANPEVVLIEELSFALAQVNAGLAQREVAELELIGRRRGRPRREAVSASGLARFTVAAGFVVEAATQIIVAGHAMQTLEAAGGEVGQTLIDDVPVEAVLPGPEANGAFGVGTVYDQFDDLVSVEVTTALAGGQDEEDIDTYLAELVDYLQIFFDDPTLVNARQLAIYVRSHPTVERVLVLDLHVPAGGLLPDGTTSATARDNVAGAIAAYPVDAAGEPPAAFIRTEIAALVQARREANMILGVGVPTHSTINVTFTLSTVDATATAAVLTAAQDAVRGYLQPAQWGSPSSGDQTLTPGLWVLDRTVRFGELYAVINNVPGVKHVDTITISPAPRAYTVAAATDLLTLADHGYLAGDPVVLTAPTGGAPLVAGTTYYVRDVTASSFKLAATSGGAAIDITTDGSGSIARVATANTNVTLPGAAPLTRPGSITASLAA